MGENSAISWTHHTFNLCYNPVHMGRPRRRPGLSRSEIQRLIWKERLSDPKFVHPMKGKHFSEEARKNMGRPAGFISEKLGIPRSIKERLAISIAVRSSPKTLRGQQCHSFKDGRLKERRGDRFSDEYKRWRFDVFVRDHFKCQICRSGCDLVAHHIKPFCDFPELRFVVSNGLTLCYFCHTIIEALKHYAKKGGSVSGRTYTH